MTNKLPPIYFYIPEKQWPVGKIPQHPNEYWQWMSDWGSRYGRGKYDWTLQTYLHLKADNFPCELVDTIPESGIVIAHRDFLPDNLKPSPDLLFICIKADKDAHPYAQIHIVQNSDDEITKRPVSFWSSYYMPHWPQPGLIPRDSTRGSRFENAAFYGVRETLAPELQQPSWEQQLSDLGLHWEIINSNRWHDYSQTDVIIAIRSFDGDTYSSKPPSKLYNAWHAGIPAILGCDSAYRKERKSELDYIEVASVEETITALKNLRVDNNLRQAIVENGHLRAMERRPANITAQWSGFLTDIAIPSYYRWCHASNLYRKVFLIIRYTFLKVNNLQNYWLKNR